MLSFPGFRLVLATSVLVWALALSALVWPLPGWWVIGLLPVLYECVLGWHLLVQGLRSPVGVVPDHDGPAAVHLAILIAARNERTVLPGTVSAVLAELGAGDEVIVIDDGSDDDGAMLLANIHGLEWNGDEAGNGRLRILRRAMNRGKASALNDGLASTQAEVVVTLDADTRIRSGALQAIRRAFAAQRSLTAACGIVVPTCAGPGWVARAFERFQRLEYRRSYAWRLGWSADRCLALVPGAFAAFRRPAVMAVGGFARDSLVEDYELMFRLHSAEPGRLQVAVVPDAVAWTDAPASPGAFLRQRRRWFAGFIATMVRHQRLVGDPALGVFGLRHLRLKTIDIGLPAVTLGTWVVVAIQTLSGQVPGVAVGLVVASKLIHDLILYGAADRLVQRRIGSDGSAGRWTPVLLLVDPICFQPLRQLGALVGCVAALRSRSGWFPERRGAALGEVGSRMGNT